MATLGYGKRMLKASLDSKTAVKKVRRISPDEDAQFWCESGLDKDGFTAKYISDYKGFGVFATKKFAKGDFLLEYVGERISQEEAEIRQRKYNDNKIFYYHHNGKMHCLDASATQGHICQLVNDGHGKTANAIMKFKHFGHDRLCLYALEDIKANQEVLYDYGDDKNLWWRKETQKILIHLTSRTVRVTQTLIILQVVQTDLEMTPLNI